MPRPDRRGQPADQRARPACGRCAGARPACGCGARARRGGRSAPRGAVRDQGLARHGRRGHDGRHRRLARPRPGARWDRRRPAAGRRRDPARQVEHAGVHLGQRDGQRGLRPDVEPVRPRPNTRREQRRRGVDRRRRRRAVRHRQRQRQQHPAARPPVRRGRHQAHQRTRAEDRALAGVRGAVRVVHAARPDRAARRGPRARPADHRRPRRGGPARRPGPARRSGEGRRRPAAGRVVRRQRDPDADTRDDHRGASRRRCDRRDRGAPRGAGAVRHRRGAAGLGGPHPRGRLRLAVAPHRAGRHHPVMARSTRSGGSPLAPASPWPATR